MRTIVLASFGCLLAAGCQSAAPLSCLVGECPRGTHCVAGKCQPGECDQDRDCDDEDPCTSDTCINHVCFHTPGALICVTDADCAPGNQCKVKTCDRCGQCVSAPEPDGTPCDDANACTSNDVCTGGVCAGTPIDADGDGYSPPPCGNDCDDTDPTVHPGAKEGPPGDPTCSDGVDNDCNGLADSADLNCRVPELIESVVTDGPVFAVVDSGGILYIGGQFTRVGPRIGSFAVIDGNTGLRIPGWPQVAGVVDAVAPDGNDGWYIGGNFAYVDGIPRGNLAHILSDGTLDEWNPNANGGVFALAISGSVLYVGGVFTNIGGQQRNYIAALDAGTGQATNWNPDAISPTNTIVSAIAVSGSEVYTGGYFTFIGGQPRNYIAALDANTGQATAWNPDSDEQVLTLAVSGSVVYAGGRFTSIGGQARHSIAALDIGTGQATTWDPNAESLVYALAVSGSVVYVGGDFTRIGGQVRNHIAALDSQTGLPTAWNPDADYLVDALAVSGSTVYVGGGFTHIGGQTRRYIAALDGGTSQATVWDPDANSTVWALAVSGSLVYAGGEFTSIGGQQRNYIAALDANTGQLTAWNPNASFSVWALAVSGSVVYAGGGFTSIGGQMRNYIAALDLNTGQATAWDPNANSLVTALAVSGSVVYAGGSFGIIGGQMRNSIAAIDAGTGRATAWNPDATGGEPATGVTALSASGSVVYAGGRFTSIGGQSRNYIAALDASTGKATAWNPDVYGDNSISPILALAPSGPLVYAGGEFTRVGEQTRNNIAALDANTGQATSWNPDANSLVWALAVSGTMVYAGGNFKSIGGQTRNSISALDASTGQPTSWNPEVVGLSKPSLIYSLSASGSSLVLGGNFTIISGWPQQGIAIFR